ncbi:urease accessory protein UreD [Roseibacillus ishigakijimensis]|uniref:Urease accessory protein UreD n=1 Tax=Roseibacillus ishigakijimensis TaxID=454146 RepID=A0A934RN54_9BACT|nr:urease accessory protein UreD [Roseibacillus ishigakijimensis]MBK1833845.1 urease accessory protein UreD [Roseibacillus ishigakijimensis]
MSGSLHSESRLRFGFDSQRGETVLRERRAGGLCHFGKPYREGGLLALQIVNPTAGIFAGDHWRLAVELEKKARVRLSNPSANRFHTMKGGSATLDQDIAVGAGGWLDFQPQWIIPQRGSAVTQTTRLQVAEGASLVYGEWLAPGRVAHGEEHRFRRLTTRLQLTVGERLVAREQMILEPAQGPWPLTVPDWEHCFYGAFWVVGAHDGEHLARAVHGLPSEGLRAGYSELQPGVGVVRLLAARSLLLKGASRAVRESLEPFFPLLAGGNRLIV